MAKSDNLKDFLTDVADAIRAKKGTSAAINPQDFASEIASIESGGGGMKPNVKNGVYIHTNDGRFFTKTEWSKVGSNSNADGVAVIADEAAFVICPKELGNMSWSSDTTNLVEGLPVLTAAESLNDFDGVGNTQLILATDTSGAAYTCANYMFGSGRNGYLPSAGEWNIAYSNASAIGELMTAIGGDEIGSQANFTFIWSSSQASNNSAIGITWNGGRIGNSNKPFFGGVRAFMKLW